MKKNLFFILLLALVGCSKDEAVAENSFVNSQQQVQGTWKLESQTKGYSSTNIATDCAKNHVSINFTSQAVTETSTSSLTSPCNAVPGTSYEYSISAGSMIIFQGNFKIKYNISLKSNKLVLSKIEVDGSTLSSPIYYTEENRTTETYVKI